MAQNLIHQNALRHEPVARSEKQAQYQVPSPGISLDLRGNAEGGGIMVEGPAGVRKAWTPVKLPGGEAVAHGVRVGPTSWVRDAVELPSPGRGARARGAPEALCFPDEDDGTDTEASALDVDECPGTSVIAAFLSSFSCAVRDGSHSSNPPNGMCCTTTRLLSTSAC